MCGSTYARIVGVGMYPRWLTDAISDRAKATSYAARDFRRSVDGHLQVSQQAVLSGVNPSVHGECLTRLSRTWHDNNGDVSVHEHIAGFRTDDLIGRHAANRAADPEDLGVLIPRQVREEVRVPLESTLSSSTIFLKELGKQRYVSIFSLSLVIRIPVSNRA